MGRTCIIIGCRSKESPFYHFPNPDLQKERFLMWLSACGNPTLFKMPLKKLKQKSVCKEHFELNCFIVKRLSKSAVPTLRLPRAYNIK